MPVLTRGVTTHGPDLKEGPMTPDPKASRIRIDIDDDPHKLALARYLAGQPNSGLTLRHQLRDTQNPPDKPADVPDQKPKQP